MGEHKANGRGKAPSSKATQFGSPERAARLRQLSTESEGMLEAMRHVVTHPASEDRTYEQHEYRAWLRQDRKGFMHAKARLEMAASRKAGREQARGRDDGHPLDRLFRERR